MCAAALEQMPHLVADGQHELVGGVVAVGS